MSGSINMCNLIHCHALDAPVNEAALPPNGEWTNSQPVTLSDGVTTGLLTVTFQKDAT